MDPLTGKVCTPWFIEACREYHYNHTIDCEYYRCPAEVTPEVDAYVKAHEFQGRMPAILSPLPPVAESKPRFKLLPTPFKDRENAICFEATLETLYFTPDVEHSLNRVVNMTNLAALKTQKTENAIRNIDLNIFDLREKIANFTDFEMNWKLNKIVNATWEKFVAQLETTQEINKFAHSEIVKELNFTNIETIKQLKNLEENVLVHLKNLTCSSSSTQLII